MLSIVSSLVSTGLDSTLVVSFVASLIISSSLICVVGLVSSTAKVLDDEVLEIWLEKAWIELSFLFWESILESTELALFSSFSFLESWSAWLIFWSMSR